MAIAGLFLITFLFVHMTINLLIKIFEFVLFGGIIIHIIYGIFIQIQNWMARPQRYKVEGWSHTSPFSKFMIHTAVLIFIFLIIHLGDFYIKAKFLGGVQDVAIDGKIYHDLADLVIQKFQFPLYAFGYILMMVFLGFHLHHGFQSAFQSLGLNHSKYITIIKAVSTLVAILLSLGFLIIPLIIYFGNY